jgi:hypothetical protein
MSDESRASPSSIGSSNGTPAQTPSPLEERSQPVSRLSNSRGESDYPKQTLQFLCTSACCRSMRPTFSQLKAHASAISPNSSQKTNISSVACQVLLCLAERTVRLMPTIPQSWQSSTMALQSAAQDRAHILQSIAISQYSLHLLFSHILPLCRSPRYRLPPSSVYITN